MFSEYTDPNSTLFHNNSSPQNFIHKYFNTFVSKKHEKMLLCTVNKNVDDNFGDGTSITIHNIKSKKNVPFTIQISVTLIFNFS